MVNNTDHGIGHISRDDSERIQLAKESIAYNKKHHLDKIKRFIRFFDEKGDPLPPAPAAPVEPVAPVAPVAPAAPAAPPAQ
jgi:hypothetical protein